MTALPVLLVALAQAPTWEASLPVDVLVPYVGDASGVMVVGAGTHPETPAAVTTLQEVLAASQALQLIMDGSALGNVSTLSDQAIARQAAGLPVELVLIVRTFPGAAATALVVTIYDTQGERRAAFSTPKGKPLPPFKPQQAAAPLPGDAPSALDAPPRPHVRWLSSSKAAFGEEEVDGPAFYRALGKPELATRYLERANLKSLLVTGGLVAAGVGALVAVSGFLFSTCSVYAGTPFAPGECVQRDATLGWAGVIGGGAGVLLSLAGWLIPREILSDEEQQKLVRETMSLAVGPAGVQLRGTF